MGLSRIAAQGLGRCLRARPWGNTASWITCRTPFCRHTRNQRYTRCQGGRSWGGIRQAEPTGSTWWMPNAVAGEVRDLAAGLIGRDALVIEQRLPDLHRQSVQGPGGIFQWSIAVIACALPDIEGQNLWASSASIARWQSTGSGSIVLVPLRYLPRAIPNFTANHSSSAPISNLGYNPQYLLEVLDVVRGRAV